MSVVNDEVSNILDEGEGDYDRLLSQVRETIDELRTEAGRAVPESAANSYLATAHDAVVRLSDPGTDARSALTELAEAAGGVHHAFDAATASDGGWYQLAERLNLQIEELRDLIAPA